MQLSTFARTLACTLLLCGAASAQPAAEPPDHDHAHEGGGQRRAPQNSAHEDETLPPGSIVAHIVDPSGKPLAGIPVTLGIIEQSVAKGESRRRELGVSAADGNVRWDNLPTGSSMADRISINQNGATFAVTPFQLSPSHGQSAIAHVFPVERAIDGKDVVILSRTDLFIEIKDDRVQIEQDVAIANFGSAAWVPDNVSLDMPQGMTAFTFQQGMNDIGLDPVEGKTQLRLRGTFAPGQHRLTFRWQLPYSGERQLSFKLDASPNMAQGGVAALPAPGMKLDVSGMGEGKLRDDLVPNQRMLGVDWDSLTTKGPLRQIDITLRDIPEAGLPGWLLRGGIGLAVLISLGSLLTVRRSRQQNAARVDKDARAGLLDELVMLEQAHQRGEVGPKTYERARRELIDQLALTLARA